MSARLSFCLVLVLEQLIITPAAEVSGQIGVSWWMCTICFMTDCGQESKGFQLTKRQPAVKMCPSISE